MSEQTLWKALDYEDEFRDRVVMLLLTHKPELIESVRQFSLDTALHYVFGYRDRFRKALVSEEFMRMVWEMSPPSTLHKPNADGRTPLQYAISNNNMFAMELVLGKLSVDEVLDAFRENNNKKCPPEILDKFRGYLASSLHQDDVVGMVGEYLGCREQLLAKRTTKRRRRDDHDDEDDESSDA